MDLPAFVPYWARSIRPVVAPEQAYSRPAGAATRRRNLRLKRHWLLTGGFGRPEEPQRFPRNVGPPVEGDFGGPPRYRRVEGRYQTLRQIDGNALRPFRECNTYGLLQLLLPRVVERAPKGPRMQSAGRASKTERALTVAPCPTRC